MSHCEREEKNITDKNAIFDSWLPIILRGVPEIPQLRP